MRKHSAMLRGAIISLLDSLSFFFNSSIIN